MTETEKLFLDFDYPQTIDLLKSFITLISATLVFCVAFSEKIIGAEEGEQAPRRLMYSSWTSLFVALMLAGCSIVIVTFAAGCAVYQRPIGTFRCDFLQIAFFGWALGLAAGVSYVRALMLLISAAKKKIRDHD